MSGPRFPASERSPLAWRPIDADALDGASLLVRCGAECALARFDGARFVYPATPGIAIGFAPTHYYRPGGVS